MELTYSQSFLAYHIEYLLLLCRLSFIADGRVKEEDTTLNMFMEHTELLCGSIIHILYLWCHKFVERLRNSTLFFHELTCACLVSHHTRAYQSGHLPVTHL